MPGGYEQLPDYGGRPPLDHCRVLAVVIYAAVVTLVVWLVRKLSVQRSDICGVFLVGNNPASRLLCSGHGQHSIT